MTVSRKPDNYNALTRGNRAVFTASFKFGECNPFSLYVARRSKKAYLFCGCRPLYVWDSFQLPLGAGEVQQELIGQRHPLEYESSNAVGQLRSHGVRLVSQDLAD